MTKMEIRLPPRYVNCPAAIVYAGGLSAGALRTFLRIYGLHWDKSNPPRLSAKGWIGALGMGKTTLYDHLKELEKSGWLRSGSDGEGVLSFEFQEMSGFQERRPGTGNDATLLITDSNPPEVDRSDAALRKSGKRKARDPRLDHPAVRLYRQVMRLTASEKQRQTIIDTVADVELWRETLEHWADHGWRPTNLPGLLDSYQRGGRSACATCRRIGKREATSQASQEGPAPEELRAMIAKARGGQRAGDRRPGTEE